jgi:hypothetical protein
VGVEQIRRTDVEKLNFVVAFDERGNVGSRARRENVGLPAEIVGEEPRGWDFLADGGNDGRP